MDLNNNNKRSFFIVLLFFILYGVTCINLYFIQIKNAPFFQNLAEKQYHTTVQNYPQRGYIFDRYDNPIAINKDSLSIFVLPKDLINKTETLSFLEQNFPGVSKRFERYKHKNFMFVKRNLSQDEIEIIQKSNINDIHFLKESNRFYPYESLGTIIGITDIDNNGLFGIEQLYNTQLKGSPTTFHLKKDAKQKHFYFAQEKIQEGTHPKSIKLTIDADLQFKYQQILDQIVQKHEAKEAAALCLDPETGEVLAMVSCPNFDPNMTKDLDIEKTKNRPISECFESGSVIKVFAALAALEQGVVTVDEVIDCENTKETKIDHLRVRTVTPHGKIPFINIIKGSNNIGIVKVTKRLGQDLYDYYKLVGFGQLTGLNMPGEQKGFVNHPSNWSAYSIQSLSYGYEMTTNLLQLARAFSVIINNGYLITPTLIKENFTKKIGPIISQKTVQDLRLILEETIQTGSGKLAQINGYKTLGKTGTSNLLVNGAYNDNKHLYTFIGAVEHNNYKRVIVTYIKECKTVSYASRIAAPIFKTLAETTLLHDLIFTEKQTIS